MKYGHRHARSNHHAPLIYPRASLLFSTLACLLAAERLQALSYQRTHSRWLPLYAKEMGCNTDKEDNRDEFTLCVRTGKVGKMSIRRLFLSSNFLVPLQSCVLHSEGADAE